MSNLGPVTFPTLGFEVADWIEAHLCRGPGDVMGDPVKLPDEAVRFLAWAYRLDPKTGKRLARLAVLSRPKGWAKTELAGMLVCAELLGPVRCDGFDSEGRPVGVSVRSPFIRTLATEEGQAGLAFDAAAVMLSHAADTHGLAVDVGLTRIFTADGGQVRPSTASAAAKDGGRETFAVADELHLYLLPEHRRMFEVVRRNLAKRRAAQPWMVATTTAWRPGEDSVAEQVARSVQGEDADQLIERGIVLDHQAAPEIADPSDDDEVMAGLKIAYGSAVEYVDMKRLMAERHDPTTEWADFARYFLNTPTRSSDSWMAESTWAACAHPEVEVEADELIALGFDGSLFADSTVLVGCRIEDGHLFVLGCWERPEGPEADGWEVPREEVDATVHETFERFEVARFYADPAFWQSQVDEWAAQYGEAVAAFWTSRDVPMARALERLHTAAMSGDLSHDGDWRLADHVANAFVRRTRSGVTVRKERPKSPRKIDGVIAAALAFEARADAVAAGQTKKAAGRFYSF